jgi:hypothetical protein
VASLCRPASPSSLREQSPEGSDTHTLEFLDGAAESAWTHLAGLHDQQHGTDGVGKEVGVRGATERGAIEHHNVCLRKQIGEAAVECPLLPGAGGSWAGGHQSQAGHRGPSEHFLGIDVLENGGEPPAIGHAEDLVLRGMGKVGVHEDHSKIQVREEHAQAGRHRAGSGSRLDAGHQD